MSLIEVKDLSKYFKVLDRRQGLSGAFRDLFSGDYRIVKAVDGISFNIEKGEVVGYIGPNGAGKSTTIKMMTGILKPTSGTLQVNGLAPYSNRISNAANMGVVFGQRTQLWWDLPVIESFKLLKQIYRVDDDIYRKQIGLFNDLIDLKPLFPVQVRTLSLGQRMLCDIAASFLHSPKVVFLDEPTIGLDVSIKAKIRNVIMELNRTQQITIILTTHDLSDIEALCQRVIIIDKGVLLHDGPIETVTHLFGSFRTLKVQLFGYTEQLIAQLSGKTQARFQVEGGIQFGNTQSFWTDITIDQSKLEFLDVLNYVMTEFPVKDLRIEEISMENVVQKIYDGALL